jgi:hypothetical protein
LKSSLLIVLAFFIQFAASDNLGNCDFNTAQYLNKLRNLNEIQKIEVNIDDYRKWTVNTLEAFISRNTSITDKYKKKYPATVIVHYSFGKCLHQSKVRLHGDWKDHINFEKGGRLNQSIDVALEDGSIANIVKFKLLLPKTRRHENEIILTKILRIVDLIAPRTSLIPVQINGTNAEMLFQEKASKELLESMYRREGPLFEGDERFLFNNYNIQTKETSHLSLENLSLAKITNDNWASSNLIAAQIAINSFSMLQKVYMTYGRDYFNNYILDWKLLSQNNEQLIEEWAMYEILLFATNSSHALRPHNRKFYYNSLKGGMEPIYFDGNPRDMNTKWIRQMPQFGEYSDLKSEHFLALEKKIRAIEPDFLSNTMEGNLFLVSEEETKTILENILVKISRLHESFKDYQNNKLLGNLDKKPSIHQTLLNNIREAMPKSSIIYIKEMPSAEKPDIFPANICSVLDNKCIKYSLNISEIGRMLERKKLSKQSFDSPLFIYPASLVKDKTKIQSFDNGLITAQASEGSILSFNEESRILSIDLITINDWVLIKNSHLNGIKVILKSGIISKNIKSLTSRFNQFGLTGCLSFYNTSFKNTQIIANALNTRCEDVINIINSSGKIENLKVVGASADGLDIDFSDLSIASLAVYDALNDCLDLSQGNYKIESGVLKNCGDKAISVGEQSLFLAKDIIINQANIGIASKDSSESSIDYLRMRKTNVCAEAFQKKQEFYGAKLKISNLECNVTSLNKDKNSLIQVL